LRAWFGRLSLRYKLTLTALGVEALMLAFLIINGVQLTSEELQQQAEHRAHDVSKTLVAALLAPLSQQDDASVRDVVETIQREGDIKMIEVRDSNKRIVGQVGVDGTETDFRLVQPVDFRVLAESVYRPDLYREAAVSLGITAPEVDYKSEGEHVAPWQLAGNTGAIAMGPDAFFDGRVFNPDDPQGYLQGFGAAPDTARAKVVPLNPR